ncbi:MAG: L,D-transpeptidase [Solirubrobacteraceae bacterium]
MATSEASAISATDAAPRGPSVVDDGRVAVRVSPLEGSALIAMALALAWAAPAEATRAAAPSWVEGAAVTRTAIARARPNRRAHAVQRVWSYTPFSTDDPVLPVLGHADGGRWLRVRLPERPNGATGWIQASLTRRVRLGWRITVDLSARAATIAHSGRRLRRFSVVIGKPSTPTPRGHFFVIDRARLDTWWARGTWALFTSAYSEFFQATRYDPGEIALHSRGILPDPPGSAASHGCLRFTQRDIDWLVRHIPNGTPLDIHR